MPELPIPEPGSNKAASTPSDASFPKAEDKKAINNCHFKPKNMVIGSMATPIGKDFSTLVYDRAAEHGPHEAAMAVTRCPQESNTQTKGQKISIVEMCITDYSIIQEQNIT